MKYLEVVANARGVDMLRALAEKVKADDVRFGAEAADGMLTMRMLVRDEYLQDALDALQHVLGAQVTARIVVLAVETSLPKPKEEDPGTRSKGRNGDSATAAREALYEGLEKSVYLDFNFFVLVVLSTVVAAIGLIEDNVAVVIGAMVIAPLLGPNLALSLGTALGDLVLTRKAALTLVVGIGLSVLLSAAVGVVWQGPLDSREILSRTDAGLDSVALALASGAAGALSLTSGVSSVLVGVMVAVALLPPATTLGLMLGHAELSLASGAGLLLAVNIVCVNLASKLVFFTKGIRPRTWFEQERAQRAMVVVVIGWVVSLLLLLGFMYARRSLLD